MNSINKYSNCLRPKKNWKGLIKCRGCNVLLDGHFDGGSNLFCGNCTVREFRAVYSKITCKWNFIGGKINEPASFMLKSKHVWLLLNRKTPYRTEINGYRFEYIRFNRILKRYKEARFFIEVNDNNDPILHEGCIKVFEILD